MTTQSVMIPFDKMIPSNYRDVGDVSELQAAIAKRGIISPILLIPTDNGMYKIFAGHRRRQAAMNLGLKEGPAFLIRKEPGEDEMLLDQLAENNVHDKDGVTLAIKCRELRDRGVKNAMIAGALGKGETWASTIIGLVLKENAPYMAFITGKPLWYQKKGDRYFLSVEDIRKAGENEADYEMLEGIGVEAPSIYYCDELVRIYKNDLNPENPEHLNTFNKYVAALINAKRNKREDLSHVCKLILKKISEDPVQPGKEIKKPVLDLDKTAESLTRIFSKGVIEDPKELQKRCRRLFKKQGIPYRIFIEERDLSRPESDAERQESSNV